MRRWVAAVLAAAGTLAVVASLRPPAAAGTGVATVVVARDVAAGAVIGRDDVELAPRPVGSRPETALDSVDAAVGRVAAGPLATHEVVTASRLLGPDLLAGQPADLVALGVPVLDTASVGVRPGSRVDLYATGSGDRVAADVAVLTVQQGTESGGLASAAPPRITVALDPARAAAVARSLNALDAGQTLVVALRRNSSPGQ